ncbi:MAG: hypothetical protein ABI947_02190 [Chloroflexota bacterium]
MPVKQYRCVVSSLAIRTQPQLGDSFKTPQQIKMGDVITLNDDSRTEAAGYIWLKHDRGWSAERSSDGKTIFLLDASLKPKDRMWGLNIDPYNPAGNPPAARLTGLGWVRFVFHIASKRQTPEQAFAYYDPIIQAHVKAGTKVLLVLIHDTYLGNAPWNNGGWDTYTSGYADCATRIAQHYRGQVTAYEIWNEGDLPPQAQSVPTSVYIPPQNYGPLLLAATRAIKQADPAAKVISGGLVSGDPAGYMSRVRDSLGGVLPMDAIGLHPYGKTLPDAPVFTGWSQGLLTVFLAKMTDAFPGVPIWITEYGVPRVDVNNASFWPPIATYMLKTFQLMRSTYFFNVPVVIWFAWADSMDNAGIVKDNQNPKGVLFDTFFQNVRADQPAYTRTIDAPYDGKVMLGHVAGQFVAEASIGELAQRIFLSAGNVGALLVKTSAGTSWEGQTDSKVAMAISSSADVQRWASELTKYHLDFHAWHDVSGQNIAAETALIVQIAMSPGVGSLVLDLDPTRLTLKTGADIRNFMIGLKRALPATYHIGVTFDSRPETFGTVNLPEWFPFINSWHPKIFHWLFGNTLQGPQPFIAATFNALKAYPKPIVPMLQAEASAGKPVPPDQIKQAAKIVLESYNTPAVTFWRTGAIGPAEFGAIQTVYVPYTAGFTPTNPPDVLVVQINTPLRIRASASITASVVGTLQPGEQITVLERRVIGTTAWVRHSRGWTVARDGQTGEVYLA